MSDQNDELLAAGRPAVGLRWEPWRPDQVTRLLSGISAPWCVAGGWALDLFRGGQTREHGDIEIAVPGAAFDQVRRALAEHEFEAAGAGKLWPLAGPAFAATHQTWVSEPAPTQPGGRVYRLDVFREPSLDGRWAFRRDERVTLPYVHLVHRDSAAIPYLAPEVALLFKAKDPRAKDESDFLGTLPLLSAAARRWLRQMLELVHPEHAWIGAL